MYGRSRAGAEALAQVAHRPAQTVGIQPSSTSPAATWASCWWVRIRPTLRTSAVSRRNWRGDSSIGVAAGRRQVSRHVDDEVADDERVLLDGRRERRGVTQGDAHPGQQHLHDERLGDVVVGAVVEGGDHPALVAVGGDDDDRAAVGGPQPAAQLDAVEVRQPEIEDDELRVVQRDDAQRVDASVTDADAPAARAVPATCAARAAVPDRPRRRGRAAARQACGIVNETRAPPPGRSPSRMVPPWASTIALHTARPMPSTPVGPAGAKKSTARARAARRSPARRRRRVTSTIAPDVAAPTVTGVPPPWRSPFSSRLVSTWSICVRSTSTSGRSSGRRTSIRRSPRRAGARSTSTISVELLGFAVRAPAAGLDPAEAEQVADDPVEPIGLGDDEVEQLRARAVVGDQTVAQLGRRGADRRQRVAQVVGHRAQQHGALRVALHVRRARRRRRGG